MGKLMEILHRVCPDIDFEKETRLIDDGILDSFDVIAVVNEIIDAYGIDVDVSDLEPENFNSAQAMWEFIQQQQA